MARSFLLVALLLIAQTQSWRTAPASPLQASRFRLHAPQMVSAISAQMAEVRASMRQDAKSALLMDALRGSNINDDDQQGAGIDMKIVETRASGSSEDVLPYTYQPERLEAYFGSRPGAVAQRVWQVLSTSSTFMLSVLGDYVTGNTEDMEVRRAAQLRNTIVSLGPFFIKLGQALSIRPDILSPRAMVELQQLCDKVPCYSSKLAYETIETELGRSMSELYSEITPEPVAAASLGQVYKATLRSTGEQVAVKVQRPFVLETVSLDLFLVRNMGKFLRNFPQLSSRLDIVALLDEFAGNFYQGGGSTTSLFTLLSFYIYLHLSSASSARSSQTLICPQTSLTRPQSSTTTSSARTACVWQRT